MKNKKDIIKYIEEHRDEIGAGSIHGSHCMLWHLGMEYPDIKSSKNSAKAIKLTKKLARLLTIGLKKLGCPINNTDAQLVINVNDRSGQLSRCLGLDEDCKPADRLLKVLKA